MRVKYGQSWVEPGRYGRKEPIESEPIRAVIVMTCRHLASYLVRIVTHWWPSRDCTIETALPDELLLLFASYRGRSSDSQPRCDNMKAISWLGKSESSGSRWICVADFHYLHAAEITATHSTGAIIKVMDLCCPIGWMARIDESNGELGGIPVIWRLNSYRSYR